MSEEDDRLDKVVAAFHAKRTEDYAAVRTQAFAEVYALLEREALKYREAGDVAMADAADVLRAKLHAIEAKP